MLLDRRTFHRTVRAKHAAIPWLGLKQGAARFAVIEKLAGISRHDFRFGMPALRAGNRRFEHHGLYFFSVLIEDGYPAFLVASVNWSVVAAVSSNCTVAVLLA
jgi:hypothetical protein